MPTFLRLDGIEGEVEDKDHKNWIRVNSVSFPIFRTIPEGAKDQERTKGTTSLGPVAVNRQIDKTSPKLSEAAAKGKFIPEAEVHICNDTEGKREPWYKVLFKDVVLTNYTWSASGDTPASSFEDFGLNYTECTWTYVVIDSKTNKVTGNVETSYNPNTSA